MTARTIAVMDLTNWRVQELIIPLRWSQLLSPQTATLAARITSSATTVRASGNCSDTRFAPQFVFRVCCLNGVEWFSLFYSKRKIILKLTFIFLIFLMVTGDCIWESWVCDKESDCSQAEDEENCHGTETGGGGTECTEFRCLRSGGCIPFSALCNGHQDCADNTDEEGCGLIMPGNIRPNGLKCMYNKYSMNFDRN